MTRKRSNVVVDTNDVERTVGLVLPARTPQQGKTQTGKASTTKDPCIASILGVASCAHVLPIMDVSQIHDWIHDWYCEFMIVALRPINFAQGGCQKYVPHDVGPTKPTGLQMM